MSFEERLLKPISNMLTKYFDTRKSNLIVFQHAQLAQFARSDALK